MQTNMKAQTRWPIRLLLIIILWAILVALGGLTGVFTLFPLPLIALLVVLGIATPLLIYKQNAEFRTFIRSQDLNFLTTFHLWRIPAALIFFYFGMQGLLPETFVRNAGWGDLVAGLLVLPTVLTSKGGLIKYMGFHLFGFADFILAFGTGFFFSLSNDPAMMPIAEFPLVLIPLFGVPISGVSHILAFDLIYHYYTQRQNAG